MVYRNLRTIYYNAETARIVGRTHEIGRDIGENNPGVSERNLAFLVLDYYKKEGFFVGKINQDGTYNIDKRRLTDDEYNKAYNNLQRTDENGFTPGEKQYTGK